MHHTEVADVPAYWAPADGPVLAMLKFGGGICAEPPHHRGIQHLIEHLALTNVGPQVHDYNGFVDLRSVTFLARGDETEVRTFFDTVIAALRDLPDDRHDLEPGVLSAEASRAPGTTFSNLLACQYGFAGPGLTALPELGVGSLSAAQLRTWVNDRMHTGNAVVVCSRDPSFLDLDALPRGHAVPRWELPPQIDGPGWIGGNTSGFGAVATCPRDTATATMLRVLRDHLMDSLRHRSGLSYSVETSYEPVTADAAILGLFVDAAPERRLDARNALLEALDRFVDDGPDPRWLELDAGRLTRAQGETLAGFGNATTIAAKHLLGDPNPLDTTWLDEYRQIQAHDLSSAASRFLQSASWQMPNEAPMPPWRGLSRLQVFSDSAVNGRALVAKTEPGYQMVAGSDGLSAVHGPDRVVTVLFNDVIAVEAWDDGSRIIHARDATRLIYDATVWAEDEQFAVWLDGRLQAPTVQRGARPSN